MNEVGRRQPENLGSMKAGSRASGHLDKGTAARLECECTLFSQTSAEHLDMQENSEI